jgi:ADP-ribose pyrophosphatase
MEFSEKTISSKYIYKGKILNLKVEEVELINGKTSSRELIEFPNSVSIIAVTKSSEVILVKQFRKPCESPLLEIVAGKVDKGEDFLDCAKRELKEETGYTSNNWKKIASFYTTPGYSNEFMTMYLALDAENGNPDPDEDEFLEVIEIGVDEFIEMVDTSQIKDAKTVMAAFYLKSYYEKHS